MNILNLKERLLNASGCVQKMACKYVTNTLPDDFRYVVSNENQRQSVENINKAVGLEDALASLWNDGKIPMWVDVSCVFVKEEQLYFLLILSDDRTKQHEQVVWKDSTIGPFRCKSPTLPIDWKPEVGKFDLNRDRKFL